MSIEGEAVRAGFKVTAAGVQWLLLALLLGAVCTLTFCSISGARKQDEEIKLGRAFRDSINRQTDVSVGTEGKFNEIQGNQQQRANENPQIVVLHDRATQEAANNDPDTADFLNGRIPQRLLDADRKARESRRLQESRPR